MVRKKKTDRGRNFMDLLSACLAPTLPTLVERRERKGRPGSQVS
jgi:hypothetical protein